MELTYLGLNTLEYDVKKCTGCGMCAIVCPHRIYKIEDKKAVVTAKEKCIECGACAKNCAFDAIHVDAGPGCAAAVLYSMFKPGSKPECGCSGDPKPAVSCCGGSEESKVMKAEKLSIAVLGTGCPKCEKTEQLVRKVVDENGLNAEIIKVKEIKKIMKYNVMSTPAVAINGKVKIEGKLPTEKEIKNILGL